MPVVVNAFNYDVTRAFLVAVGLSAGTLLAALIMEWKDIRKPKGGKQVEKKCVKDVEKDVVEESNAEPRDSDEIAAWLDNRARRPRTATTVLPKQKRLHEVELDLKKCCPGIHGHIQGRLMI